MVNMHVQIVAEVMRSRKWFPHASEMQHVERLSEQCLTKSTTMCQLYLYMSPKCKKNYSRDKNTAVSKIMQIICCVKQRHHVTSFLQLCC